MPLAPGTYRGVVTATGLGFTKKGDGQMFVTFDVDGQDGGPPHAMTWYGYFSDAAEPMTTKALAALGFDLTTRLLTELNTDNASDTPLAGVEADLVLKQEEYEGVTRTKIAFVNRPGGAPAVKERMDPAQATAFAKMLQAKIKAKGGRPSAPPPQQSQAQKDKIAEKRAESAAAARAG